ncbi:hypothetical protein WJX72_007458 [[Myrmecia] bisecta]|uniref:Beta-glucosidase n=1 Tax=[Myrmecia] bisecta TaxID=41462 RepID=A0AAW1R832_9CHLO
MPEHGNHSAHSAAISVYQNSGGANTNWSEFEQQKKAFGRPTILHGDKCGVASDFWNRYEEDIALTKGLNSTCFRFSIEWGRIEPQRGQVDRAAVQRYHQIFDCLDRHQLEPVVTLYHFVHPSWFEALGGFTKEDSIALFVAYAETVFREFGSRARLWVTFNEPGVQAFCQYIYGVFPPAKIANFATAGRHYMHMLRAHTATYNAIKSLPGGSAAQVGLVHNFMRYEAAGAKSFSGYYVGPLCKWLEHFWGTQITVQYFKTGKFTWACPMGPTLSYQEPSIPGIDFVGLNYYGRVLINWKFEPVGQPGELMTDMPFPLYAPGLYEGIAAMSALGVPVYITETGVADSQGDRRQAFLDTYIPQVERAVRDGFDVRGFMYWTVVDNFEWDHGYHIKFGLYEWNPDGSQARSETASARQLRQIYSGWPARIAAIHGEAREARAAVPAV